MQAWVDHLQESAHVNMEHNPNFESVYQSEAHTLIRQHLDFVVNSFPDRKLDIQTEVTLENFARVDLFVPEFNLIVEVNGPTHFNAMRKLNKKTQTRIEFFRHLGYQVVSIDIISFYIS